MLTAEPNHLCVTPGPSGVPQHAQNEIKRAGVEVRVISCFMGELEVAVDIRMNKHGRLLDRQVEAAKKFRLGRFSFWSE